MARSDNEKYSALALEIRRQLGTEPVKRFVRSLPAFAPEQEAPRKLRDLLGKLERAEALASTATRRR
ncbi:MULTISPECIES: hypothetical protein [unclassified Mesorhizobium]|uniref:hypothetical protein n=1 Tax=unclassified Mesorhizobium TaxID=325217 RepID=UPI003014A8E5